MKHMAGMQLQQASIKRLKYELRDKGRAAAVRGAGEIAHSMTAACWCRQARRLQSSPLEGLDVQLVDAHAVLTAMCLHPQPLSMST